MRHCIDFRDFVSDGKNLWVSPRSFNGLMRLDIDQINSEYITGFENTMQSIELHGSVIETEDKIYFIPSLGGNLDIYDKKTKTIESVSVYPEDMEWHCLSAYLVQNKIVLLPFLIDYIVCYDIVTGEILKIAQWEDENGQKFLAEGNFFCGSATVRGNYLYAVSQRHEGIMIFNILNMSIEWKYLSNQCLAFSTLVDDGKWLWLAANNDAAFIQWNIETNESRLLNNFPKHYHYNVETGIPFCSLVDCKDRILAVAIRANISLWLDKETGDIFECELLRQEDIISFNPNDQEVYRLAKKIDEYTILLISCKDQSIVQYNWMLNTIKRDIFNLTLDIQDRILETRINISKKSNSGLIIDEGMIELDSFIHCIGLTGKSDKQKVQNDGYTIGAQIFEMVKNELRR